jgi:hypothetical protein
MSTPAAATIKCASDGANTSVRTPPVTLRPGVYTAAYAQLRLAPACVLVDGARRLGWMWVGREPY